MKYITFFDNTAVVFPDTASHKEIAGDKLVRSAGYCRVETYRDKYDNVRAKVSCWGKSDSLGVASMLLDERLVANIFI